MDNKDKAKKTYPVTGMSCASCAARVSKALNSCQGVYEANINYASATALVTYNPRECTPADLKAAVQNAGYDLLTETGGKAIEETVESEHAKEYRKLKRQTIASVALSVPVMLLSMFLMDVPAVKYVIWLLSTIVVFVFGRRFHINAFKQLRHRSANMDTLVSNSTGIAYLFSVFNLFFPGFWLSHGIEPHVYFESASMIIAFILLGRLLEARAKQKTSTAIRKLMGLQPKTVTVLTDTGEKDIPVEQALADQIAAGAAHTGQHWTADCTGDGSVVLEESETISTGAVSGNF